MEKAKEMYQRKVRFPEDVRQAIERNGEEECRQFNTELIYQLRKVYGLTGEKHAET
ncbi:Arc family DNA binding domain-containing protein [Raoultella ornithinolytica]|uniref:Arc family DNA binding domain-containing protein n=1 Tax=Raoultella ornithinolytica TaxID=54291 RepID=UPI001F3AC339|nr:Arc family DNA binding domain-containing protein [Raoultella ornithinolytica]EKW7684508.1 Arc family DNA binding domain-containing protein [Raoultella ornithinolytica]ELN4409889.1 Arc family DNA binding domain-containing protein [Raoultella ornithinolytica]ELS0898764.1 Arc family DNA binding domain-containing protein [Raoultella ornithinolytica]MCF6684160.1 Arc family DNA binding domain-containing protein [Raoultella ornithinolytica]